MSGPRRRSRVAALQILHQMDVSAELDADGALGLYFGQLAAGGSAIAVDEDEPSPSRRRGRERPGSTARWSSR